MKLKDGALTFYLLKLTPCQSSRSVSMSVLQATQYHKMRSVGQA